MELEQHPGQAGDCCPVDGCDVNLKLRYGEASGLALIRHWLQDEGDHSGHRLTVAVIKEQ
jgi:hypothetical protein